eukprot:TRINITY_DN1455_c0_g1_i1.p1 TRINITY_DN1455_c0_g1~~TRINITY_DN1455_c0_g1_i1.p1  ORF type:complete len:289 (+),score=55.59 TRINITY_DN1455_c0_g1_i1:281-1147(+)
MLQMELQDRIIGQYTVQKIIGRGAEGIISYATTPTGQPVAIKTIEVDNPTEDRGAVCATPPLAPSSPNLREKSFLSSLCHQNIITLHDSIEEENKIHLILEYASKGDLFDYIVSSGGRLKETEARTIFNQIVLGLEYLHQNHIIHKDIKLENIFLKEDNSIVIGDFGIAVHKHENFTLNSNSNQKRLFGSIHYVAPEVLQKKNHQQLEKQDVWSLGVILFAMCCGHLPFDDDHSDTRIISRKIVNGEYKFPKFSLSPEYKDLVSKLLDVDPPTRYSIKQIKDHPWTKL